MKYYFLMIFLLITIPALNAGIVALTISKKNMVKKRTDFELALAQLYVQNPQLLEQASPYISYEEFDKKKVAHYCSNIIPFIYFCFESYKNYHLYKENKKANSTNVLSSFINSIFPQLFTNAPKHIAFFLQEAEILLQAYLFKLLLKMATFCFL